MLVSLSLVILLRDVSSKERAKLFLMPDGAPLLYLNDESGEKRVELASMSSGLNGLIIFDAQHQPRYLFSALPGLENPFAGLVILGAGGHPTLRVGATPDGAPVVEGLPAPRP